MLSEHERWIYFYELNLETRPLVDPIGEDLRSLLGYIQPTVDAAQAVKIINADTAALRLASLAIHQDRAELLVHYSDKKVTDPAFAELETGELRVEPKLDGEGIAVSAHVVLNLNSTPTGKYLGAIESVPGLPASKIADLISHLIANVKKFEYEEADKIKRFRIYPRFDGLMSQRLADDLEEGYLSGVELYEELENPALIDGALYYEDKRVLRLRTPHKPSGNVAANVIQSIKDHYVPGQYGRMRVMIRKEGRTRGVEVPPHIHQAIEALSVRQKRIYSVLKLSQCAEQPNAIFLGDMVAMLD